MMGSRGTIDLDPPGALGPWYQGSPFAKTTRSLAPWMGRGPGDQAGSKVEVPGIQGADPAGRRALPD